MSRVPPRSRQRSDEENLGACCGVVTILWFAVIASIVLGIAVIVWKVALG